jgi:predicted  nucleic acid-binding Zn-ribbon protein
MGINVGLASSQAESIRQYASALRDIRNSLNQYKASLNNAWQADEMHYVNLAIDQVIQLAQSLSADLDSVSGEIVSVANEIRQEEEAREAAARAAAERELALKLASLNPSSTVNRQF